MKNKIKTLVKKNKYEIIEATVMTITVIAGYTFVCNKAGYRMVTPHSYDESYFYVKTLSGKILRSAIIPTE